MPRAVLVIGGVNDEWINESIKLHWHEANQLGQKVPNGRSWAHERAAPWLSIRNIRGIPVKDCNEQA